jgi:hypothetical protein
MGRMRYGVHAQLETEANDLIARSMEGVTSHSAKSDILTPWKEQQRKRKEVYVASGIADPAVRLGMYNRVINPGRPDLNSRDGGAMPAKRDNSRSTLADHVARHLDGG